MISSGGDIKAGIIGAITAGVLHEVGQAFSTEFTTSIEIAPGEFDTLVSAKALTGAQKVGKFVAHGAVGAAKAVASGGDALKGFASGAFGRGMPSVGQALGITNEIARRAASVVAGGVVSQLGGGKFASGAKTAAFLQLFSAAGDYYRNAVGRLANALPGENSAKNTYKSDFLGRQKLEDMTKNVIGLNEPLTGKFFEDFLKQGGALSKALNVIPTMNATAGLHDRWFNGPNRLVFTPFNNEGTMLPAAAISIGASIGRITQGHEMEIIDNLHSKEKR
jgi:hypothetical protein